MGLSVCGVFECAECKRRLKQLCPGCEAGNQMLAADGKPTCRIFDCARVKGVESCNDCDETTCEVCKEPGLVCHLRSEFEGGRRWLGKIAGCCQARRGEPAHTPAGLPERTVNRLRWYLHALDEFSEKGMTAVSSWRMALKVGVTAGLIRKDLSYLHSLGKRGVGYDIGVLQKKIIDILGLDRVKHIAWVGAARLMQELGQIERLAERNCRLVAVFDSDADKLGTRIGDLQVMDASMIKQVVKNLDVHAAVVACVSEDAQRAVDQLVSAGVAAILNLTSVLLVAPGNVVVRNLDVASEMLTLSYYCSLHGRQDTPKQ